MRRRGVELSVNMIILIVLAIIVLVVLIYVFQRFVREGTTDLRECTGKGGVCRAGTCEPGESSSGLFGGGCGEGNVCCLSGDAVLGSST